jgi:hypothetical protein
VCLWGYFQNRLLFESVGRVRDPPSPRWNDSCRYAQFFSIEYRLQTVILTISASNVARHQPKTSTAYLSLPGKEDTSQAQHSVDLESVPYGGSTMYIFWLPPLFLILWLIFKSFVSLMFAYWTSKSLALRITESFDLLQNRGKNADIPVNIMQFWRMIIKTRLRPPKPKKSSCTKSQQ